MVPIMLPEPPTEQSLSTARTSLESSRKQLDALSQRITQAETRLRNMIVEARAAIDAMQHEQSALQSDILQTEAYLAPVRRLPNELLRAVFLALFEEYCTCAWVLSAVCATWRREALKTSKIWSKIRLTTNENATPETIRLWLERSGNKIPLDIEIYLRVGKHSSEDSPPSRSPSPPGWTLFPTPPGVATHYVYANAVVPPGGALQILPPSQTPAIAAPTPIHQVWSPRSEPASPPAKPGDHWGHIAFFYLAAQMHRWERFIFRYDRQFASVSALKSINGKAPMLRDFEISCAYPSFANEWTWLPATSSPKALPNLKSVTLLYTNFKWSSPMLSKCNLTSIHIHALPTYHLHLDRIQHIVSSNQGLVSLQLFFTGVLPAILPLNPITLEHLKVLTLGGSHLLTGLIETLTLPALEELNYNIEARDPIEDILNQLLTRSNHPPLTTLSMAYGSPTTGALFYTAAGISWDFLASLNHVRTFKVGGMTLESLLTALGPPEEDNSQWLLPNLERLAIRNCHSSHSDGIAKLVQMVDARNPPVGVPGMSVNGVTPVKLKELELADTPPLERDVLQWLMSRVNDLICPDSLDDP